MSRPAATRATFVAVIAVATAAVTGCAVEPSPLPEDVVIVVLQPRGDVLSGRLVIQVRNGSDQTVEIAAARVASPDFATDAVWSGDGVRLPAGSTIDLRARVPAITCDAQPDPVATLDVRVGAAAGLATRSALDPHELLPRLHRDACLRQEIATIAAITPREVIVPDGRSPDARSPAVLVLDVRPTGAAGTVVLEAVDGTTLLQPARDGVAVDLLALGIALDADGPTEVRIPFVPNRCDPHALAEDKVGTVIPFIVSTPTAHEVRWPLAVTDDQRGDFAAYWSAYCGFAPG